MIIFQLIGNVIHFIDNVGASLEKDIVYALHQFLEKHDALHGLSELYCNKPVVGQVMIKHFVSLHKSCLDIFKTLTV